MQYLLTYLIFLPLVAAFVALCIPAKLSQTFRLLTLAANLLQVLILGLIITSWQNHVADFQLIENHDWISINLGHLGEFKASYYVALDGLSLPMVVLSVVTLLIATISSWKLEKNRKGYFILLLILNSAVVGSFAALDFLLFYLFFEFMLLPIYFLIGIWGGPKREYASIKFFLFTLLGSLLILMVIIALFISYQVPDEQTLVHTFRVTDLTNSGNIISGSLLDLAAGQAWGWFTMRQWAFILLMTGFAIKLPAVPLHSWLPDAHVEAPTAISVLLAALLLKFGGYGILRFALPIFPQEAIHFSWTIGAMGLLSILYGAFNALGSKDLKRMIAYSSISHMGFVLLGIASLTPEGFTGAIFQMVSHGILSAMLFLIAGVIYDRTRDRLIENYSGLHIRMQAFTGVTLIAFFASLGLPGFSGFMGELWVLIGAFNAQKSPALLPPIMAVLAVSSLVLTAGYFLWTLQRMFYGPFMNKSSLPLYDLTRREYIMFIPLSVLTLYLGIFPQTLIDWINPFAESLIKLITGS